MKGFRSGVRLLAMVNLSHPPLPDSIQIIWAKARTPGLRNKQSYSPQNGRTQSSYSPQNGRTQSGQAPTREKVWRLPAGETAQSGKCHQGLSAHLLTRVGVTLSGPSQGCGSRSARFPGVHRFPSPSLPHLLNPVHLAEWVTSRQMRELVPQNKISSLLRNDI